MAAATRNDDVVHHAGGVVPLVASTPTVVTVHDLQPLEMPDHFSALKRRWLGAMIPRSVRTARLVLCPSRFTADRIGACLGVGPDRVRVVPHGHEPVAAVDAVDPVDPDLVDRYGRYLLFPAIAYPHKRHVDLIAALDHLRRRFDDVSVVLTGRPGPSSAAVDEEVRRRGLAGRVHVLGRVPDDELDRLYRSATALVFPSAYEGFGNPVLEAMIRGCPVVTTDAGALPDVVGEAGIVVPVGDPRAIAAAVERVLTEQRSSSDCVRRVSGEPSAFRGMPPAGASPIATVRRCARRRPHHENPRFLPALCT